MDDALHRVIGIDLGTTYSAVAAYSSDNLASEIIADPTAGNPPATTTPSVVRLEPRGLLVGHPAKNSIFASGIPGETIIEIKRDMGTLYKDSAERFAEPGAREKFREDHPVHVRLGGEWRRPQEISALVLMKMKEIAQARLSGEIHDAVITVPAYFTEQQKKATEEAALLAGLYPRQLIPEPTAAAICYGIDQATEERQIYLVFDLGGGTFDVSVIETREDEIAVLATTGDQRLGGGDFDTAIAAWLREQLGGPQLDAATALRLRAAAEAAKRELSYRNETVVELGSGFSPVTLYRAKFVELIRELLNRTIREVEKALQFAAEAKGVRREDVDAILLVGGSTRIPRVKEMLLEYFERDEDFVRADANPDTLVARGAAIVARKFEPSSRFDLRNLPDGGQVTIDPDEDFQITLITEHTLSVGLQSGECDPLITRGTRIPARRQKSDYTNGAMIDQIQVPIYQGEHKYIYENTPIGTIHIPDIEPRPEGYHKFQVEFTLDVNGLLGVRVMHLNNNSEYEANFEQSTQIGQVDLLAESREALLRLYGSGAQPDPVSAASATEEDIGFPPPVETETSADLNQVRPVPARYDRLLWKIGAYLDQEHTPAVALAREAFMAAVRDGASESELDRYADLLEDAYDDARR